MNELPETIIELKDDAAFEPQPQEPSSLVDLFFRPKQFFSNRANLLNKRLIWVLLYCYSVARTLNRVERQAARADFGEAIDSFTITLYESWLNYWLAALVLAAIGAPLIWLISGWWYKLRIKWSDGAGWDNSEARPVMVYSAFVESLPLLIFAVINTFLYSNYFAVFEADGTWELVTLIFPFWALYVSYTGVMTVFEPHVWKARLWFLIIPGLIYLVGFVGLVAAYIFAT